MVNIKIIFKNPRTCACPARDWSTVYYCLVLGSPRSHFLCDACLSTYYQDRIFFE